MICSNPKCQQSAISAVIYENATKTIIIKPLGKVKAGNIVYLCVDHAKNIKTPLKWKVICEIDDFEKFPKKTNLKPEGKVIEFTTKRSGVKKTFATIESNETNKINTENQDRLSKLREKLPPKPNFPDDDFTVIMKQLNKSNIKNEFNKRKTFKKQTVPDNYKGERVGHLVSVKTGYTETEMSVLGWKKKD